MRILITNDDGYSAPGIRSLCRAVGMLGWQALVIAPDVEMSGSSRSRRSGVGFNVLAKPSIEGVDVIAVSSTPAACVVVGLTSRQFGEFDLCVSGVNAGENLGAGLSISGTFGAAVEASTYGLPGLAISRLNDPDPTTSQLEWDWDWVEEVLVRILSGIEGELGKEWRVANINLRRDAAEQGNLVPTLVSRESYFWDAYDSQLGCIMSSLGFDQGKVYPTEDIYEFAVMRRNIITRFNDRLESYI